jgi:hypothetical protein
MFWDIFVDKWDLEYHFLIYSQHYFIFVTCEWAQMARVLTRDERSSLLRRTESAVNTSHEPAYNCHCDSLPT